MSRDALAASTASEIDRWEQALTDELLRLWDRQEGVVIARLQGTKARKHTRHWEPAGERKIDPRYIVDPGRWLVEAAAVALPLVTRIFTSVYGRLFRNLRASAPDAALPPPPPGAPADVVLGDPEAGDARMKAAIEQRVDLIARGVNTARKEVEDFIAREEAAGGTMDEIVQGVREFYRTRKPVWAERISVVSAVGSINSSALMAATDAGSSAKQWVSRRDSRVRDTHDHADRQVRLLDEPFRLGGIASHPRESRLMFPGDPSDGVPLDEIINCRCGMVFSPPKGGRKSAPALDVKARVRTPSGSQHYGLPIGAVIPPASTVFRAPSTSSSSAPAAPRARRAKAKVDGRPVEYVTDDPAAIAMLQAHSPGVVLTSGEFEVIAVRDGKGRIGAYAAWQTVDGVQPKGTMLAVSVHPALRGRRLGDQITAAVQGEDPSVAPLRAARPTGSAAPKATVPPAVAPLRASRPARTPVITDRSKPGDVAGTSGDFKADAARIDRLQRAYASQSTQALFSRGGRYTAAREKQQQEIIDHFLTRPGVRADRKLLVLGGLPGSGKTTTINSQAGQGAVGIDLSEYVTVNADEVKSEMIRRGMVPDYPGLSADESATLFHAESFEVAHSLMRQAARRGLNFVYDTSLKSSGQMGFATSAAGRAAPPPYEVTAVFVDVPIPVAKQRARDRYLAGDRYMPLALIDSMKAYGGGKGRSSLPAQNFDQVKRGADRWFAFDNAGSAPVLAGQGGGRRGSKRP